MIKRVLAVTGIVLSVATVGFAFHKGERHEESGEKGLSITEAPAVVQAALKNLAKGQEIAELKQETEDGATVYEAGWKVNGIEQEATVSADGDLMETESAVAADSVPKAVMDVVKKHAGQGATPEFEQKRIVLYSVEVSHDGKESEFLVDPAGRLVELDMGDDDEEHGVSKDDNDDEHEDGDDDKDEKKDDNDDR
ncbi:hypothetical protein GC197_17430 [bacterium]|nr:hypothetical protein [bacterium]